MPKIRKRTICIYLLVLAVLYIVIAVIPSLTGALTKTEVVKHGKLTVEDKVECFVIRDETVYMASQSGDMKFTAKEGSLVKRGTKLLDFTPAASKLKKDQKSEYRDIIRNLGSDTISDSSYISQRKGCFSFYTDGYENFFKPDNMKNITEKTASAKKSAPVDLKRGFTEQGDPMYKIADNSNWYIMCWVNEADISKYETGKYVSVRLPDGTISAEIYNITKENSKWRLVLRTNRYYKNFTQLRRAEATIVTSNGEGLLISNKCITTKKGAVGVYVKSTTDDFVFKPVQVIGTDGRKTLVSEGAYYDKKGNPVNTVEIYDEVLKNPESDEAEK